MTNKLFSMREAANLLRVPPYRIAYLLNMGLVPEPQLRLANRRAFSPADILRLAEKLDVRVPDDMKEER